MGKHVALNSACPRCQQYKISLQIDQHDVVRYDVTYLPPFYGTKHQFGWSNKWVVKTSIMPSLLGSQTAKKLFGDFLRLYSFQVQGT